MWERNFYCTQEKREKSEILEQECDPLEVDNVKVDFVRSSSSSAQGTTLDDDGTGCGRPLVDCVVCEDRSSGKHYGQFTCEGCKSFFKRSVRRNLVYTCRGQKECSVVLQHRNQCQFCRFQKCVNAGMRKDAVQRGRICSMSPLPVSGFSFEHGWLVDGRDSGHQPFGLTNFLGHLLKAQPFPTPNFSSLPTSTITIEALGDLSCHLLAFIVEWAKKLTYFSQDLHINDQLVLLKQTWHKLIVLMAAQSYLPLPVASMIASVSLQGRSDQMVSTMDKIQAIQKQMERFHKLSLTTTEYACLRALVLFNPDISHLSDAPAVENLQQRVQCGLEEHIQLTQPHHRPRFGTLLLRLVPLSTLQQSSVEQLLFNNQSSQKSSVEFMIGELLFGGMSSEAVSSGQGASLTGNGSGISGQYNQPGRLSSATYSGHWQPWGQTFVDHNNPFSKSPYYSGVRKC